MTITRPTVTVEIDFTTNLSSGLSYGEKILVDGPYSFHRLKETVGTSATDASGNGRTGTYTGTVTLNQTTGKPVSGETASRYVNFNTSAGISFAKPPSGATTITLEAWVYRATLSGSSATFYSIAQAEATGEQWMTFSIRGDGKLNMASGYTDAFTSTAPIAAATWYHVAAVMDVDNNSITFYVNGAALTTSYSVALDANRVGFQRTGGTLWYWGSNPTGAATVSRIAEPALYTEALSTSQISDHYGAAATVPFAGYTWTNVTAYLDHTDPLTRRFGRESAMAEVTPMELSFRLLNKDRRFEIGYSSSPYYPNVEGGRPCRVTMVQDAVTYNWAFGYIQDFPQDYPEGDLSGTVPIVATCFLERMQQDDFGQRTFNEQLAGSRINFLLNVAGQPSSMRTLDAGANSVMSQAVDGGSPGDHALQVARSDRGLFFFDGQGYAIFQDGSYRTTNARATASQGTLGRAEIDYRRPNFHAPLSMVRNVIKLRRPGGVEQTATDSVSRSKRGSRVYSDEILLTTDTAVATRAASLLATYKDPLLRVRSVEFNPQASTGFWLDSLGVRLSDRYTWTFQPQQGSSVSRDVFVEGVADTYDFHEYEYLSTWFLSLA